MPPTVPALDPLPLPAPVWLLYPLLLILFMAHLIPMSIVLGGGFWAGILGFHTKDEAFRELSARLGRQLPAWTAATVTLGVAALLFVQLLFGPVFYAAGVLVAHSWLAAIGLTGIGYGGYYLRAKLLESHPRAAAFVGIAAWLAFAGVALAFVSQMTLMLHPERHLALYQADPHGARLLHGEPTFWPRYLHMVVGAIALGALWIGWSGVSAHRRGEEGGQRVVAFGGKAFAWAAGAEALLGFQWMAVLPAPAIRAFLGGSAVAAGALVASILLTVGAIAFALRAYRSRAPGRMLAIATGQAGLLLALMVVLRDVVRRETLGAAARLEEVQVSTQWGPLILFVALLVVGLAVVGWMVRATRAPRASMSSS